MNRLQRLAGVLLLVASALPAETGASPAVVRGDTAFAERAAEIEEGRATPARIDAAVAAYREALAADPDSLPTRWKLLQALYFRGDFTTLSGDAAAASFVEGQQIAEHGIADLRERLGGDAPHALAVAEARARLGTAGLSETDVARLYFWGAIHWASWAQDAGLLLSVRRGVADKMDEYARVSAELEPGYYRGGALRLLARLHAKLPKVPFVSGWVDRDLAIPLAERALAIRPDDSGNQLLLALTFLDLAPDRRDEAIGLLRRAAEAEPREELQVEDTVVREAARKRLDEIFSAAAAGG